MLITVMRRKKAYCSWILKLSAGGSDGGGGGGGNDGLNVDADDEKAGQ